MAERKLRCAVYTRKSTEDGLEQEFNSLDAQYEACAAYALSQRHEGWTLTPERYDDGGFSGGNMARPGLTRLLEDIASGKVDIVLLYKIDRLTRSLADFSRIVDVMDAAGASFVSITQSFNTTTSMGRLTLNMLLSFAQFEREVTGERIRDKIAASKKKGIWMGGPVPLGYEVQERKLVVRDEEAGQVRHIMRRYLALGTVPALIEELAADGYRTKLQHRTGGPHRGGGEYRRGTLYHLLANPIYRGMIVHKGTLYPGDHQPIIDDELWQAVQTLRKQNACGSSRRKKRQHPSLLVGKLFDGEGRPMTASHAQRGKKRYRYYVTRCTEAVGPSAWRVNAHDLEQLVCDRLVEMFGDDRLLLKNMAGEQIQARQVEACRTDVQRLVATLRSGAVAARFELLQKILLRIDVGESGIQIRVDSHSLQTELALDLNEGALGDLVLATPAVRVRRGRQIRLVVPASSPDAQPARRDQKLIALMAHAQAARELVEGNPDQSIAQIASAQGRCRTHLGNLVRLSCLAPDIVIAIINGRQPAELSARALQRTAIPLCWEAQRTTFGFA